MPQTTTVSTFRWLPFALYLILASCGAPTPTSNEGVEAIATQEAAAVWDTGDKPIPKNFLSRYSIYGINRCCLTGMPGGNGDSASCTTPCGSFPDGLVTAAGVDKAADYYQAIGETSLDTLEAWKAFYNFPKRRPGESLDAYRARTNVVIYYNLTELGLGRELGCSMNGNDVACYVTNYGGSFSDMTNSLNSAVSGDTARNTVVISYRASRASRYAVQFSAFGADGKRISKAQLDNKGARPIPEICMSCHGGHWAPDALGLNGKFGLAQDARFLPLLTNTVVFPPNPPYRRGDQENAILYVNNLAWQKRYETLTGRQQDILHWAYDATGANLRFRAYRDYQDTSLVAPWGWQAHDAYYRNGVLPFCDTCHMAADSQHVTRTAADSSVGNFLPPLGTLSRLIARGWERDVVGDYGFRNGMTTANYAGWAGVTGYGDSRGTYSGAWGANDHSPMPHAETAFARFWGDTSGTLQTCYLGGARPPADCFFTELGIWPTPPTASPPNATHPPVPTAVKASVSSDCGQGNVTAITQTSGTNDGRIVAPGAQCMDGCKKNEVYCPGSEGVGTNQFPGARYECVPANETYGTCQVCGGVNQPACTRVGAGCDSGFNPNCLTALPCHEGVRSAGYCAASIVSTNAAASQSSTYGSAVARLAVDGNTDGNYFNGHLSHTSNDYGEWWQVDLGGVRRTRKIEIFGRTDCCADRIKSAIVSYSLDGGTWRPFPNGDFDSAVGPSNLTTLTTSKPIELRYLQIRMQTADYLQLAEVNVWGWVPINVGGGVACATSCINGAGALQCGGNGCGNFPGGRSNCCQGTILSHGVYCGGNPVANAPCILP